MTQIEENTLKNYIAKLEKENAIMQKLSTRKGFYKQYFNFLSTSKTKIEAFNKSNDLYFSLFGKYRYSNFLQFKKIINFYKIA